MGVASTWRQRIAAFNHAAALPFVHTLSEVKELMVAIGTSNLGVQLDSYHWYNRGTGARAVTRHKWRVMGEEHPLNCKRIWMQTAMTAALFMVAASCGQACEVTPAAPAAKKPPEWQLVWSDEFNGANGSAPDAANWVFDLGGKGWGNQELETYTDRAANAHVQDGNLVITTLRETFTGADGVTRNYTSARIKTSKLFAQAYGKFEARIKIPAGQGLWPAFWMLGENIGQAGWPACGEIDIMENIGKEPSTVHGTLHGPGYSGANGIGAPFTLHDPARFADDFHLFAVEWEPSAIRFYADGTLYKTITPSNLPAGTEWVFDRPFFLLLNVAVGGSWPGSPDSTTAFPQPMLVDYVRVYKRSN